MSRRRLAVRAVAVGRASRLGTAAALGALCLLAGCPESGQRVEPVAAPSPPAPAEPVATGSGQAAGPAGPPLQAADIDGLADMLCAIYGAWPPRPGPDETAQQLEARLAGLSPAARRALQDVPLAERASERCPEIIPAESLTPSHELPRPADLLEGVPGLFDASQTTDPDADRARLEWTAIGLGCASFGQGTDEALLDQESQFLAAMGYTLDTYVSAATALSDGPTSDRILAAVMACARRAGAQPAE